MKIHTAPDHSHLQMTELASLNYSNMGTYYNSVIFMKSKLYL